MEENPSSRNSTECPPFDGSWVLEHNKTALTGGRGRFSPRSLFYCSASVEAYEVLACALLVGQVSKHFVVDYQC